MRSSDAYPTVDSADVAVSQHRVPVAGAALHTTLILPPGSDPVPVLLTRTMYGAHQHFAEAEAWTGFGYGMAIQDVRGRYRSSGQWSPYEHEREDGAATVEWLRQHPRVRHVVAQGGSYSAGCALAIADHPGVDAVISMVPATGLAATILGAERMLRLRSHAGWWSDHGEGGQSTPGSFDEAASNEPGLLERLPVSSIGPRLGLQHWSSLLDTRSDLIEPSDLARVAIPTLNIGGWWDMFLDATWSHHLALPSSTTVIGPWTHTLDGSSPPGVLSADPRADLSLGMLQLRWLQSVLEAGERPPDRLWVGGAGGWLTGSPVTSTRSFEFALPSGSSVPVPNPSDPADPLYADTLEPTDVSADAAHPAVARLWTEPLAHDLTVCGAPEVQLSIDCPTRPGATTDLIVRLCEQTASGHVVPISFGFAEVPAASGTYRVRCRPAGWTLDRESRICIDVSGTLFPYIARNPQNGLPRGAADKLESLARSIDVAASRIHLEAVT